MLFQSLGLWLLAPGAAALATSFPKGERHVRRDYNSNNWCGQVLSGRDFRDVSATWVMPKSTPLSSQSGQTIYNYQWVGIDGASANCQAILQAGTYARVINNRLTYGFWYEFFPASSWLLNEPVVNPGDSVYVEVKAYNTTTGYAYMKNLSTGKDITIDMQAPAGSELCGSTAEWIQENASEQAPDGLAPFNTFSFNYCSASDASGSRYNLAGSEKWIMNTNGNTQCYPSNVSGSSVQINYNA